MQIDGSLNNNYPIEALIPCGLKLNRVILHLLRRKNDEFSAIQDRIYQPFFENVSTYTNLISTYQQSHLSATHTPLAIPYLYLYYL